MSRMIRGKWRLIAACLSVAALVIGGVVLFTARGSSVAKASGGGGCFVSVGSPPVCTFKGLGATAQFSSIDSSGCVVTDASIFVSENVTRIPPGGTTTGSDAFLQVSQFDECTGAIGQQAAGDAPGVTFQASNNLGTASASGTATLTDFITGASFPVAFHLTWTGIGKTSLAVSSFHFRSTGTVSNFHMNSTSRLAIASGSFTEGATNFASAPTLLAEVFSSSGGTIQISN